jgi:broad specificity phosphatase PhoE
MARFLLIRHASHDLLGRALAGRMPGVHLNQQGRREAELLATRLSRELLAAVYSGPLERARETAAPAAEMLGLELRIAPELDELDLGDWTGLSFQELEAAPGWREFNTFRSGTRPPNGERMLDAQARITGLMERLASQSPDAAIALVSHCDVLRAAIVRYLGMPLDHFLRIEISPASVTTVELHPWGPQVLCLNDTSHLRNS